MAGETQHEQGSCPANPLHFHALGRLASWDTRQKAVFVLHPTQQHNFEGIEVFLIF